MSDATSPETRRQVLRDPGAVLLPVYVDEPPAEVTEVVDVDGDTWKRDGDHWVYGCMSCSWDRLRNFAPLMPAWAHKAAMGASE